MLSPLLPRYIYAVLVQADRKRFRAMVQFYLHDGDEDCPFQRLYASPSIAQRACAGPASNDIGGDPQASPSLWKCLGHASKQASETP